MHLPVDILGLLVVVGFFSGFIDSIAGGGGLITLPSLLAIGVSPVMAIGTNKLQGAVGEFSAILQYSKHGKIDFKKISLGLFAIAIGASFGAVAVQYVHIEILKKLIPILLTVLLIYLIVFRKKITQSNTVRMSAKCYYLFFGLLIGFYNGFFGPGTGTFWTISLLFFLAYDLRQAIVYTKPLNMMGNIISLIWFVCYQQINYPAAVAMSIGTFIGGRTGARFVIYKDIELIKILFLVIVTLMTIGLYYKYY